MEVIMYNVGSKKFDECFAHMQHGEHNSSRSDRRRTITTDAGMK